jgi:hypothetical protein
MKIEIQPGFVPESVQLMVMSLRRMFRFDCGALANNVAGGSTAERVTRMIVCPLPAPRISTFDGIATPTLVPVKSRLFQLEMGLEL